jgi:hypothetical protein
MNVGEPMGNSGSEMEELPLDSLGGEVRGRSAVKLSIEVQAMA